MKKVGEEYEMKMLAGAGMMLEKGHEILFLCRPPIACRAAVQAGYLF